MDVELFSKIIKELLSGRDNVSVPGLGTFIAEDVPSSFSDKGFTINPPYRTVSFSTREGKEDTFSGFYARTNGIEPARAAQVTGEFVASLRSSLETERSVILPQFGRLRLIGQGRMVFVPDENLEIFPYLDYLSPVSLKSHGDAEPVREYSPVPEAPSAGSGRKRKKVALKLVLIPACIALVLLGALAAIGRLAPDLVDPFLYDADQLEIINTRI